MINKHGIPVSFKILCIALLFIAGCSNTDGIPDEVHPGFTGIFTGPYNITESNTGPYILNIKHLDLIKNQIDSDSLLQEQRNKLLSGANSLLDQSFEFVTDKEEILPDNATANDYVSMDRYSWPNDEGEYTLEARRDCCSNPEIYDGTRFDRQRLALISSAIYTLSLSYYISNDENYAKKAAELVKGWFLNENTKMNPHLDFAQIRPGQSDTYGVASQGIIDTNDFVHIIESVSLLYSSESWSPSNHKELKKWFFEFSNWMIKNYNADAYSSTNLSTWMDVQRSMYFLFSEQEERLTSHIIPIEDRIGFHINPDGRQPRELSRTRARHYEYFNLRAFMKLVLIRKNINGNDKNWQSLNNSKYGGLKPALDLVMSDIVDNEQRRTLTDNQDFDNCRYLEIFKPAVVAFNEPLYQQVVDKLLVSGCRNPDVLLIHPSLDKLIMN